MLLLYVPGGTAIIIHKRICISAMINLVTRFKVTDCMVPASVCNPRSLMMIFIHFHLIVCVDVDMDFARSADLQS